MPGDKFGVGRRGPVRSSGDKRRERRSRSRHRDSEAAASGSAASARRSPVASRASSLQILSQTKVPLEKKVVVASSFLLSHEFHGCGGWPTLTTCGRQRAHTNVMATYRATSEQIGDTDLVLKGASLFSVYCLRAPYAYVRFARSRLWIRLCGLLA